jgi:hypothetical protein
MVHLFTYLKESKDTMKAGMDLNMFIKSGDKAMAQYQFKKMALKKPVKNNPVKNSQSQNLVKDLDPL